MAGPYLCGWLVASGLGHVDVAVTVRHRCWVYDNDGRAFWSIPEIIESLMIDSKVHWSDSVKRFVTSWTAVFERLGMALEVEYERSLRQAFKSTWGGVVCSVFWDVDLCCIALPCNDRVTRRRHRTYTKCSRMFVSPGRLPHAGRGPGD